MARLSDAVAAGPVIKSKQRSPNRWRRVRRWIGPDAHAAYLFMAPALVGFTVFVCYPIVSSAYLSLTNANGFTPPEFVGVQNFVDLVTSDPSFWPAIGATFYLVVLYVPLSLIIGLALAMFCNARMRGVRVVRTVLYLPVVVPVIATITLWKFVFNPQVGVANMVLSWLHLPPLAWLSGSSTAMPSIVIVMLWGVGATMIIFLAALQAVPTELYEAAMIDGAGAWRRFVTITLPMISPILLLQIVLQMTTALQAFAQPKILTGGGPGFSTTTLMLSIYNYGFPALGRVPQLGYATAEVWVLFVIIIIVVAATARFSSIWSYSDTGS
jgi:ABC-type sugar transport system permease subunit